MNIKIDEELIQNAIRASIQDAVSTAVKGYSVQSVIANAMASELTSSVVVQAVKDAVHRVDMDSMVESLAREIQRATIKAVVAVVQESMVEVIARLRGLSPYDDKDKRERERIFHQLFFRKSDAEGEIA